MTWRVSTREKKSVVQIDTWEKDDMTMQREIGWRWGHFLYDEKPNVVGLGIDLENNESIEVSMLGDVQDSEQDDGCWEDWTWPDELDPEEVERLEEIYSEDSEEGLENEGWVHTDSEYFLQGPLDLEFIPENYQKKPVVVQAVKFTGENEEELRLFCGDALGEITATEAHIRTLEDGSEHQVEHMATVGDYIIKGIKGEFYPCKPDIFEASYETTWRKYELNA